MTPTAVLTGHTLGPMQFGLLLQELQANPPASNVEQWVCHLHEAVDAPALQLAWNTLVARHEVLRASFDLTLPLGRCQRFHPSLNAPWREWDLSGQDPDEQEANWARWLEADRGTRFPVDQPPLFRLQCVRFAERAFRLVLTFHPLLLDLRSVELLFAELSELYDRPADQRELARAGSCCEFLHWHAGWLTTHAAELQAYWQREFEGLESTAELQLDAVGSEAGAVTWCTRALDLAASRAVRECAAALDLPLHALTTAAWALVVGSYSGTSEVVCGVLSPGREGHVSDAAQIVGLLANVLPLRVRVKPGDTVGGFLRQVAVQRGKLRSVEQSPLAAVHGWSGVAPGRTLFEAVIAHEERTPATRLQQAFGDRPTRHFEAPRHSPFPLMLTVRGEETLECEWALDAARFPNFDVGRVADDFEAVLRRLPEALESPIEALSVLAPTHEEQLDHWNQTETTFPAERLLHEWVELATDRTSEAVAVEEPTGPVTYGELEADANRLAHYLRALDAGADQFVAILLQRSARAVRAALGVLKSGAAYLPLDPHAPGDRLRFQLENAEARFVIVDEQTRALLPETSSQVICLDADGELLAGQAATRPAPISSARQLCYGIFTSGSTGAPKLIGVEHRQIANLLAFATTQVVTAADVRYVPFADSLSGDASVHQIFATLAGGGTLVLIENPLEITDSPFFDRFTYLGSTPTLLNSTLTHGNLPPAVRTVGLGAEPIPDALVERLTALAQVEKVVNFYGPTEATVYCTVDWVIDRGRGVFPAGSGTGSWCLIGRPIANTEILILDALERPVPVGVAGEIYVGGAGVARGYPRLPEQTRERFVPDRSLGRPESRFYRTGDWGRFHADGRIEFLGRVDDQVKIRGYRVEPGEVTAVLQQVPGVREAAVIALRDADETRLIAYFVPVSETLGPAELRAAAARRLPAHFLPSAFVRMDALPVTATGKLDRRALPPPAVADLPEARVTEAPRDELELRLTRLWQRVLRRPQVGLRDSFFELGGHSFLAVTLLAEVERELGCRLPLSVFIQCPTVEALAAALRAGSVPSAWEALVPIQPHGTLPPFFAVHGIGGGVLCFRDLARHLGPDQPFFGLQAVTLGGAAQEYDQIEAMAAHYVRELRTVQAKGPYSLGGLSFGGVVAMEMAHQLLAAGEEVAALVLLDCSGPGYPRYPGWPGRLAAHVRHFGSLGWRQRHEYLQVRARSAGDLARRHLLARVYRSQQQQAHLPRALADIGIAHLRAAFQYEHRPYRGSLTLLRAEQQPVGCLPDPTCGWKGQVAGALRCERVPGDHATLLHEPNVQVVAETLRRVLASSRS